MKPLFKALLVAPLIALCLSGCGGTDNDSSSASTNSSSSSSTTSSTITQSSSSTSSQASSSNSSANSSLTSFPTTFTNPLFSNGADPWLQFYQGNYYLVTTTWTSQLVMRKSPTLEGLKSAAPVYVWSATNDDACCNFWAFEFHRLNGPNGPRWYLMYTAGHQGNLDGQHLNVLESEGDDPMGPYHYRGAPMPDRWNIDGTYLQHNGQLYLLWSEWQGSLQKNWIQPMSNPWTVSGSRMELTSPVLSWERQPGLDNAGLVTEAPEVLQHNGRTFVIYSASSCNGPDYKLGMLELVGSDPMQASAWTKFPNPVFQKTNQVFGPGHNGFFKSPDGSEDWLVYHANPRANQGCGDSRSVRAQPIHWQSNGLPDFGQPIAPGQAIDTPSGEHGPLTATVQGAPLQFINDNSGLCLGVSATNGASTNLVSQSCSQSTTRWILDPTADGFYRLANEQNQMFGTVESCEDGDGDNIAAHPWHNLACQKWRVEAAGDGWIQLLNAKSGKALEIAGCAAEADANVAQWSPLNNACQRWRLQPAEQVGIISAQSGKSLDIANCSLSTGESLQQWQWLSSPCQKWMFSSTDAGYMEIHPTHSSELCLTEQNGDVVQGSCSGTQAQWRLEPQADGAMALFNRASQQAMDVANCSIDNGNNLGVWDWLDNQCQRFHLRRVTQEQASLPAAASDNSDSPGGIWTLSGNLGTHDPTIVEEDGVWYEYQTGPGIYGKVSDDGRNWRPVPSILSSKLSWWANYVPDQEGTDVWAPDAHTFGNRAYLYYSISTFGSRVSAIGLLSASSFAAGDWQDWGVVISSNNNTAYNAIDPNLVQDPRGNNGGLWLTFGSWSSGIQITRIDATTMKPTGEVFPLAARGGGIEAPIIIYRDGYYYLFVSIGKCCAGVDSTYQIMVGRATTITGPYLDKNGSNMMNGGGSVIKSGSGRWIGPGGQDIHENVIAYHAYDSQQNGAAILRIETLGWDNQGWPTMQP